MAAPRRSAHVSPYRSSVSAVLSGKKEEVLLMDVVLLILVSFNLGLYPKFKNVLLEIELCINYQYRILIYSLLIPP